MTPKDFESINNKKKTVTLPILAHYRLFLVRSHVSIKKSRWEWLYLSILDIPEKLAKYLRTRIYVTPVSEREQGSKWILFISGPEAKQREQNNCENPQRLYYSHSQFCSHSSSL